MRLVVIAVAAASASAAAAQTPVVRASEAAAPDRCEALPIGGTASITGSNGALTVAGPEGRRVLRLERGAVERLGRDVASATIRAACRSGGVDHYLLAVATPRAACTIGYHVVEVAGPRALRLSPRFGSCAEGATAALTSAGFIVTMPAGPGSASTVSYGYRGGRVTAVAPVVVAAAPPPPPPVRSRGRAYRLAAWTPPPACAVVAREIPAQSEAVTADVLLARFERDWPVEWRSRGDLRHQPFSATALRAVVTDLACLAALPGGERLVTRAARPMFESRRHGTAAFEQLDEVARGATVNPGVRAAARTFHAQMRFEVDDPRLR